MQVLAKQLAGIRWNVDTVAPSDGSPHHFHTMTILPPPSDGGALPPLVVFPHGGPHSVYGTDFFIPLVFMALQGMAVTVVNYRGSTVRAIAVPAPLERAAHVSCCLLHGRGSVATR